MNPVSTKLEVQQQFEIERLEVALEVVKEERDYFSRLCDIKDETLERMYLASPICQKIVREELASYE